MHYQHLFHAGNFADVFKHALLCALLRAMNDKPAAWTYYESHAGAGGYDLGSAAAQRTGEAQQGVARVLAAATPPPALAPYLELLQQCTDARGLAWYPGSPWLAARTARAQDQLVLCEREPAIAAQLRQRLGEDPRIAIHRRDGYELHSLLPPASGRGLVLIDPPFERPDEFDALQTALSRALARFAGGVYAVWYPYKKRFDTERWLRRVRESLKREAANYILETGAPSEGQMHACGMLIVNPPYRFQQEIAPALPWLARYLAQGPQAQARAELWPVKK